MTRRFYEFFAGGGKDFAAICEALRTAGYRCGTLIVDAVPFVPQSRPRLFVFALRADIAPPHAPAGDEPRGVFHPCALRRAWAAPPANYNEAYRLTGDGAVVPVVRYLARDPIEPALALRAPARAAA